MPRLVIDEICRILKCAPNQIGNMLTGNVENRNMLLKFFSCRKLRTTYRDRNGFYNTFQFGGITRHAACEIKAFGHLSMVFNCSVSSYYLARHRIRLKYPFFPCIINYSAPEERRYFPIELLELAPTEVPGMGMEFFGRWQSIGIHRKEIENEGEKIVGNSEFEGGFNGIEGKDTGNQSPSTSTLEMPSTSKDAQNEEIKW
jgi:hypothetical protein